LLLAQQPGLDLLGPKAGYADALGSRSVTGEYRNVVTSRLELIGQEVN
jgi:hypothetical protein